MVLSAFALWSGSARASSPEPETERPIAVEIDVSKLAQGDAPHIERMTAERVAALLVEHSYAPTPGAADKLAIRIKYLDEEDLEYAIYVDVYDDGKLVEPGIEWFVCKFCPQTMLAETVVTHVPEALDLLSKAEASATAQQPGDSAQEQNEEPPSQPGPPPPRRIGWLGITGAIVAGGGLATTGFGVARLRRGEVTSDTATEELRILDYRPQGQALIGAGVAVVMLGTAALVTDLLIRGNKRREDPSLTVTPSLAPRSAHVAFSIRF